MRGLIVPDHARIYLEHLTELLEDKGVRLLLIGSSQDDGHFTIQANNPDRRMNAMIENYGNDKYHLDGDYVGFDLDKVEQIDTLSLSLVMNDLQVHREAVTAGIVAFFDNDESMHAFRRVAQDKGFLELGSRRPTE